MIQKFRSELFRRAQQEIADIDWEAFWLRTDQRLFRERALRWFRSAPMRAWEDRIVRDVARQLTGLVVLLALTACAGKVERNEPVEAVRIQCSPGGNVTPRVCPADMHCAVLKGGSVPNECRPSCETDSDCNDGFGCSGPIGWFDDGSVETLACERWESKGY